MCTFGAASSIAAVRCARTGTVQPMPHALGAWAPLAPLSVDTRPRHEIHITPRTPRARCRWMASAGATARMHFDSSHNIFVQVVGHKRMLLVSPEQWDELYMCVS